MKLVFLELPELNLNALHFHSSCQLMLGHQRSLVIPEAPITEMRRLAEEEEKGHRSLVNPKRKGSFQFKFHHQHHLIKMRHVCTRFVEREPEGRYQDEGPSAYRSRGKNGQYDREASDPNGPPPEHYASGWSHVLFTLTIFMLILHPC